MASTTPVHTAALIRREAIAEGTMAFHFAKAPDFEFRAGQAMDITLLDPPETDAEGNTRAFSIASAPFDKDLMIATRMRDSAFKRVLRKAELGLNVKIEGPSGSLVLHRKAEKPAVFLAGGIGITPFLSIIRQAAHEKAPHRLYLFYSNRRPEDAPFLDVLADAARQNPKGVLLDPYFQFVISHVRFHCYPPAEWASVCRRYSARSLTKRWTDASAMRYPATAFMAFPTAPNGGL
jgi:ferredoxin-NADP reductase